MKNILILILLTIVGCSKETKENSISVDHLTQSENVISTDSLSVNDEIDTVEVKQFPEDKSYGGKILIPALYHHEEADESWKKEKWMGLFKNEKGYYLKNINISLQKANDPIADNENEKTGWEISVLNKPLDSCYFLISRLENLKEGIVKSVQHQLTIAPDKPFKFKFLNKDFEIFSTAKEFTPNHDDENYFSVSGYQLYIKEKNSAQKTLLSSNENFDDSNIEILFIGDLDGDLKPDMIIDNANHYNVFNPMLYLSSSATNGKLLEVVAMHLSVGC